MKLNKLVVITAILLFVLSLSAYAATGPNLVEALRPLQNLNLADAYEAYWFVFDFVFALILFLGVTRGVLLQRYPGGPGAMIAGALSLFLAFGFIIGEKRFNFRMFHLSPYILFFALAIGIFVAVQFLRQWGAGGRLGLGILLLVIVSIFNINPEMVALKESMFNIPVVGPWFALLETATWIIGVVMLVMGLIGLFRGWGGGATPAGAGPMGAGPGPGATYARGTPSSRWNPRYWLPSQRVARRTASATTALTSRLRIVLANMQMRANAMQSIVAGYRGPAARPLTLNYAFDYLDSFPPVAIGAPTPPSRYLNGTQTRHVENYRDRLVEHRREWRLGLGELSTNLARIATLDATIQAEVARELGRPIP